MIGISRNKSPLPPIVRLFFEIGFVRKIKRSQLKDNGSNIAEHSFRVAAITYFLSKLHTQVDTEKMIVMALFHDISETRTGDIDLVQKGYVRSDEAKALSEQFSMWTERDNIISYLNELHKRTSLEAKLVHDADIIEELLTEKEQAHRGDPRASGWMKFSLARLMTPLGKQIGREIMKQNPDDWWQEIAVRNYVK